MFLGLLDSDPDPLVRNPEIEKRYKMYLQKVISRKNKIKK
jgi:hypothetical protein